MKFRKSICVFIDNFQWEMYDWLNIFFQKFWNILFFLEKWVLNLEQISFNLYQELYWVCGIDCA